MDSVYNNTFVPLNAGQSWEGKSESISKFTVASVSCITDVSGILHLYFSLNNNNFDFIKTYTLKPNEPFIINQKVEGKWFKAKVINNSGINQTYLRLTTTYKEDIRSDLDIRPLHSEKDTISIPALNECIIDGKLVVSVESVTVSGVTVDISGQRIDIDGETVKSQIYDYNNYAITSQLVGSKRGLDVNNIGTVRAYEGTTIKEIGAFTDSHNKVNLQTYDDALNDKINSSDTIGEDTGAIKVYVSNTANNRVKCDVSGQILNIGNFPTNTNVSGSVTVSNFPATQNVSGSVNITNSSLAVTGSFYPSIQDVSGSVNVGNFPSTQNVSGNVNITNSSLPVTGTFYPSIQDVSGSVNVGNFPSTQNVSGSVNITNSSLPVTGTFYPSIQDVSGSVNVSNFPATQNVSGNVNITNSSLPVTGTFYPSIQDVSGSVNVGNFPSTQNVSGSVNITNSSLAVTGTFYPSIQDVSGSVNVSNFPATQNVSGNVTVNTISGFALETGGNLATIATNSNKFKFGTGDDLRCEVINSGTNNLNVAVSNQLTGFALEAGNLASIKTNTDKNNYDASGNLKINLASGSISVSSVNIKDSSGNNIYADGSGNLKTNIQNSFLDVHNKVYHNGNWVNLVGASNGHLIVNSSTQDGNGTDITSTVVSGKTGLDVNIAGGSSTSLIKDSSGNSISAQVSGAAYAGYLNTYNPHLANATLDNSITTINKSLVQGSSPNIYLSNRCNSIGDQYVVLSTNGGGNTVQIDTTNNKVKIDPSNNTVSFASGQSVGITSSSNTVKIGDASNEVLTLSPTQYDATKIAADTNAHMVGYSRTDSGYNTATLVRPYTSNSSANSVRAVDSYSYNVCLNNTSNLYLPITSTTTDTTQSMDTFINNSSTINNYATTGLNMYQIYPKRKTYQLSGISSTGALNTMLSNFGTNTTFSSVSWGQTALKTFYASMGAGGTTKYLRFEYVDSNGDLQTTGTVGVGTGSGTTPLLSSIVGINRIYFASAAQSGANNQAFGTSDNLYVSTTSGSITPSYYGGFYYANWNSTYTCPNFKVAILKNFSFYASSASDVYAFVCDSTGGRRMLAQVISGSNFIYQNAELQINPGETLFFGTGNNTTPLNKQVFAQIYQYDV
jgi:hypothetical protein